MSRTLPADRVAQSLADDRVRAHTDAAVNANIDRDIEARIRFYADQPPEVISQRLAELDREWDVERSLEVWAGTLNGLAVMLALKGRRTWLLLPAVAMPFLIQHALQGWCPPVALFRRRGVRTRKEIELEKSALKALRGDFENAGPGAASDAEERATRALAAAAA